MLLYVIVLYCVVLRCVALHFIALHFIALHCIALHCIALHCIALHCIVLYCNVAQIVRSPNAGSVTFSPAYFQVRILMFTNRQHGVLGRQVDLGRWRGNFLIIYANVVF